MNRFFRTVPAWGKCSVSTLCASYFNKFFYTPLEDCSLRFPAWDKELSDDPNRIFVLDRLRFGFKLIPESDPSRIVTYESDNYSSATCPDFKPEMDSLFTKELALGRISLGPIKPCCVHPNSCVPKKDSGKSRPITDCSLHGITLNDHIKSESMGAPGRCATCHLSDFAETWPV